MDQAETMFRAAGESYRRAEQHLADAENSLRKLLAKLLVAEMEKPAPVQEAPSRPEPPTRLTERPAICVQSEPP